MCVMGKAREGGEEFSDGGHLVLSRVPACL